MAATRLIPATTLFDRVPEALSTLSFSGLTSDSRRVRGGELFIALRGIRPADAHVEAALQAGAAAVLLEAETENCILRDKRPVWATPAARALFGQAMAKYYVLDENALFIAGVTGTNGKSSVTHLLDAVLPQPTCVIGTLGWGFPGRLQTQANTTPDIEALHATLHACREQGARSVAMEVSSHALALNRVAGVPIQLAVFTNLTRDHLDFHGDMEAYFAAKASLFTRPGLRYAVLNADDPYGEVLRRQLPAGVEAISFGFEHGEVRPRSVHQDGEGLHLEVQTPSGDCSIQSGWLGRVNVLNLLAALAAGILLGGRPAELAERLGRVPPVPGRLQRVGAGRPSPLVVVDYAHTPDALETVLKDLRQSVAGKLLCVFGCGGDRDRGKRPQMGRIAEAVADWVVLTDDNPRSEPPQAIMAEILAGMQSPEQALRLHDRARAIEIAIRAARMGDCVLIAGKGHENYQEVAGVRRPFDDVEVARGVLEQSCFI